MKPMESDGEAVGKVSYEKEQESTKPAGAVFVDTPEKLGRRNERTDPQMSYVSSAQPEGTDPAPIGRGRVQKLNNYTNCKSPSHRDLQKQKWTNNSKNSCKFSNNSKPPSHSQIR